MKRVTVILVALTAGVIYADSTDPGLALGYQFLPDPPVGFTLSTYDALWGLGMEGTLSAGGSRSHGQSTDRFSLSLGLNTSRIRRISKSTFECISQKTLRPTDYYLESADSRYVVV